MPLSTIANGQPRRVGEQPVGRRAVPHHDPVGTEPVPDQRRGRRLGLARHLRDPARRGGDRGHERPGAREDPVLARVGRVGVGGDEARARPAPRRRHGPGAPKSNSRWNPQTTAATGASSSRSFATASNPAATSASSTPGPPHTSTRAPDGRSAASSAAAACALESTSSASAATPMRDELRDDGGGGVARVVGEEADPATRGAERGDRRGRAADRASRRATGRRRGRTRSPRRPRRPPRSPLGPLRRHGGRPCHNRRARPPPSDPEDRHPCPSSARSAGSDTPPTTSTR